MSEEARGWQPIETHDRDPEWSILAWEPGMDAAIEAAWRTDFRKYITRGGGTIQPTHWMPLPAPPNSEPDGSTLKDSLRDQLRVAKAERDRAVASCGNLGAQNVRQQAELRVAREALTLSREGLAIAAGWARTKPGSDNARTKIKSALDAIRSALSLLPKEGEK